MSGHYYDNCHESGGLLLVNVLGNLTIRRNLGKVNTVRNADSQHPNESRASMKVMKVV